MNDLVFISLENWDEIWRRNQFICAELSRRYPHQKILFVGLPHDNSHSLRRGRVSKLRPTAPQSLPDFPNIFFFRPTKWWPNTLERGRKANEFSFRQQVKSAAHKLGITRPLLWINAHSAHHLLGQMDESATIYDITDDWISAQQSNAARELLVRQDADLCARADATIVCSQRLFDMKTSLAKNLFLVPNGVDLQHYAGVAAGTTAVEVSTCGWNHPVLGYVGTVHPERVDVALVEAVARAFPQGTVALVGPNLLGEAGSKPLATLKNVVLTGAVSYAKVPAFLSTFDVCLVPHLESEFTESLNPIKLWEYLATGKPVVSTNVAGFRDFSALCHIASGAQDFVAACHAALSENAAHQTASHQNAAQAARLDAAQNNSWKARVDQIEAIIAPLGA